MAFSTRSGGQYRTQTALAEINITPLVDVVLVLLIIFMLTAPVLQSGINVAVPHTRSVNQLTAAAHRRHHRQEPERLPAGRQPQRRSRHADQPQRPHRAAAQRHEQTTPPTAPSTSRPMSASPSAPSPR